MIVPKIDILVHEQESFIKRVQMEIDAQQSSESPKVEKRSIRGVFFEKVFHGWLECEWVNFLQCRFH